jgi:hypothetical protein
MRIRNSIGLVGLLLLAVSAAPAATIYLDPLNGAGTTALDGTTPGSRGGTGTDAWAAGSDFKADGSVSGAGDEQGAWLPFVPQAGKVYTLSADVDVDTVSGSNWITLGFAESNSDLDKAFYSAPDPNGYGTIGYKGSRGAGDGFAYSGAATAGGALGTFDPADSGAITLSVVLDTTAGANSADWTLEYLQSGTSFAGPSTLSASGGSGDLGDIRYVGFTNLNDVTGDLSNFSLTEIPEPASLALIALGAFAMLRRRRH